MLSDVAKTEDCVLSGVLALQNRDGGWGYTLGGTSWTEPTALALLALRLIGQRGAEYTRGLRWLKRVARPDGGYAPHPSVLASSWVTCLPVFIAPDEGISVERAITWLLRMAGRESNRLRLFYLWLTRNYSELRAREVRGWPWYPDTTAWVTPTALSVLALEYALKLGTSREEQVRLRAEEGRRHLLASVCRDGGWNYGTPTVLGVDLESMPEPTGQAIMAVAPERRVTRRTIDIATAHLARTRSVSAAAWLMLGLRANGLPVPPAQFPPSSCVRTMDIVMSCFWSATLSGLNVFKKVKV